MNVLISYSFIHSENPLSTLRCSSGPAISWWNIEFLWQDISLKHYQIMYPLCNEVENFILCVSLALFWMFYLYTLKSCDILCCLPSLSSLLAVFLTLVHGPPIHSVIQVKAWSNPFITLSIYIEPSSLALLKYL